MDAIQTLIADLEESTISSQAQPIVVPTADFIAALNEIEGGIGPSADAILVESGSSSKISAFPAAGALSGTEIVPGVQSASNVKITTAAIAALAPAAPTGANPSATAGPAAVNGAATTFMRSDGAPAVQKCSNSQFGLAEPDNDTIQSTTAGVIRSKRNDVSFNFSGVPGASQKFTYIANRAFEFPSSLTGSQAVIGTNPTATLTVNLFKNGSSIGSIAFSTGGVPTLTFASLVNFAIADIFTAICPASPDATGADIAASLEGFLT